MNQKIILFCLDEVIKKDLSISNQMNLKNSQSNTNLEGRHSSLVTSPLLSTHPLTSVNSSPSFDKIVATLSSLERLNLISEQVNTNSLYLSRVSDTLPRKDPYLKVILGGVDVSILNKADKWTYKQEYEKFKFIVTSISLVSSLLIWSLTSRYRAFDALFQFLLVWYYCTLTIRESILIVNGSNINRKFFKFPFVFVFYIFFFSLVASSSFYSNSCYSYFIDMASITFLSYVSDTIFCFFVLSQFCSSK